MLPLEDPRWSELIGGYRVKYDARPLLDRFAKGTDLDACWKEVWDNLHHQSDVGTASYAAFPHLVRVARDHRRDWNLYGFGSTLLVEAGRRSNPAVPRFLERGFSDAKEELFEMALSDIRVGVVPMTLRAILEYLAVHGQAPELAEAIGHIDLFEDYGERVLEAERNGRN